MDFIENQYYHLYNRTNNEEALFGAIRSTPIIYIHSDYHGSVETLTDQNGNLLESYAFDPWGKMRNPNDWSQYFPESACQWFDDIGYIGYTGHTHLFEFDIINMNGRIYDPLLGQFLQPDKYIQAPENSQNYNRYAYCLNNPMKYTDPSGDLFIIDDFIIGFIDGFFSSGHDRFGHAISKGLKKSENSTKIWTGLFHTDFNLSFGERLWQFVSRFTWELPQTTVGFYAAHGFNMSMDINWVKHKYGATVFQRKYQDVNSFTLGSYIIGSRSIEADPSNSLFQHEYGHYLQSQSVGWSYLSKYALPSAFDVLSENDHRLHPVEQDANARAIKYFDKYIGSDYYSWDFYKSPIFYKGKYYNHYSKNFKSVLNKLISPYSTRDFISGALSFSFLPLNLYFGYDYYINY